MIAAAHDVCDRGLRSVVDKLSWDADGDGKDIADGEFAAAIIQVQSCRVVGFEHG